uniref:Leucine-rich repeat-containing protein let-4 n=1 Tax=Rhabditophanes sp. KR3021 TaxID=114890 RepID=A0AC35U7R2_9BILA
MTALLEDLNLADNSFEHVPSQALKPLENCLKKLQLNNNSIAIIEAEDALPPLNKLTELNLSNNKLSAVQKNFFDNVRDTIQTINFGYNKFTTIPASSIRGFKQLVSLHFISNQITALDSLTIMNLPNLNLLNFASNKINFIHKQAIMNVPNLRFLYLSNNLLQEIQPYQFSSFSRLEMIDLSENKLKALHKNSFSQLQSLNQLYLTENQITTIEKGTFTNSTFAVLFLEQNKITDLKAEMFEGATKLQQLSLKNNLIHTIETNVFESTPSLVMIDLSHNKLIDILPSTFFNQNSILLLDLSYNQLTRTPYGAFSKRVVSVLLQENPLVCSERIHMLQEGMGIFIPNSEENICKKREDVSKPAIEPLSPLTKPLELQKIKLPQQHIIPQQENTKEPEQKTPSFVFEPNHDDVINQSQVNVNFQPDHPTKEDQDVVPVIEIESDIDENNNAELKLAQLEDTLALAKMPIHPLGTKEIPTDVSIKTAPLVERFVDTIPPLPGIVTVDNYKPSQSRGFNPLQYMPPLIPTTTRTILAIPSDTIPPQIVSDLTTPPPIPNLANNPNAIYQFPVPHLKPAPKMSQAYVSGAPIPTYTLPPNVMLAEDDLEIKRKSPVKSKSVERFEKVELQPEVDNLNQRSNQSIRLTDDQLNNANYQNKGYFNATTIIYVCLVTVVVVMIAVFIGLAVAKHQQNKKNIYLSQCDGSTYTDNTRPGICHPASQAANLDAVYGTLNMHRIMVALKSILVPLTVLVAVNYVSATCPDFFKGSEECTCFDYADGSVVKCTGQSGTSVIEQLKKTPMQIKELYLAGAGIIELGPHAFRNLTIKKLVLDNNKLKSIRDTAFEGLENCLNTLSLNMNKLTAIPRAALSKLKALSVLSMKCNMITSVPNISFNNTLNLIDLDLSCNQIGEIEDGAFTNIKANLQNLNLDQNSLTTVPHAAIKGMVNLIAIHLKHNSLSQLKKGDFADLPSLELITLTGNKIATIDKNVVNVNNTVKFIYLGDNDVHQLKDLNLAQFKEVQVLDLSYNKLTQIEGDQLTVLERIQQLNLEANSIKEIAHAAFSGTPLLLLLMPFNCLSMVSPGMFQNAPYLKQISMANNNIHIVQPLSFSHLPNLNIVDLTHNKIKNLSPGAIVGSEFLTVKLQENPMVCSQEGFHVMSGAEALSLNSEPNLVCKTDYNHDYIDVCPKKTTGPPRQPCCTRNAAHTPITTTVAPEEMTKKYIIKVSTTEAPLETTMASDVVAPGGTNMHIKRRKFNMDRFWKLSHRPADYEQQRPTAKKLSEDKESFSKVDNSALRTESPIEEKAKTETNEFNLDEPSVSATKDAHVPPSQ